MKMQRRGQVDPNKHLFPDPQGNLQKWRWACPGKSTCFEVGSPWGFWEITAIPPTSPGLRSGRGYTKKGKAGVGGWGLLAFKPGFPLVESESRLITKRLPRFISLGGWRGG